jgi:hypothetical protein
MAVTDLAAVTNQIQKFWAPIFMPELKAGAKLPALVSRDYEGVIKTQGDTVKVTQIVIPDAQKRTVGTDANTFDSSPLTTQQVNVTADSRIVVAIEVEDLVDLQSQLQSQNSEIRSSLLQSCMRKLNADLYSKVAPSASSPDHIINSVTDFNATQASAARMRAAQARWMKNKPWYGSLDPSFYNDMLNASTLTSRDYVEGEQPVIGGEIANKRFGVTWFEDDALATDQGVIFHPDFLWLVMQTQPQFKLSDLHGQKKFAYLLSVDFVYGAKLGIDGSKKHQLVVADSSATSVVMAA